MTSVTKIWQPIENSSESQIDLIPNWLITRVGKYAAQILWQRGWQTAEAVESFLDPKCYIPSPIDSFGVEMEAAIARICVAIKHKEPVAIWGDFDADGITATAVLWEGLGQFFKQEQTLFYYIPNRFRESHGLSIAGIDWLKQNHNCNLIITCDTGSTSLSQIEYANSLGIDLIITDHHTLPSDRPSVVSIINPRYLAKDHPLYHLSGVAVAYKLVESLYAAMPEIPTSPIQNLLDLVAIGLVADLVELKGECRYLAQIGIEQLKKKERAGVKFLLEQCKKSGDRPTDISFGIAPRINAISRIWGDAAKCVTLLTSNNLKECQELADLAEQANIQRKGLQKKLFDQVQKLIAAIDLSTTAVIVLANPEWNAGILGLVAGQAASEYGRPVILCTVEDGIAKGSARSTAGIDLYSLVSGLIKQQSDLLLSFGGHPFAAGLSLLEQNLELFREAIQQQFWQVYGQIPIAKIKIDLELTLREIAGAENETIGKELFDQLRLLEPFGMGHPTPKILVRNCHFNNAINKKIKTKKGQKLDYLITEFKISDRTAEMKGTWWDHYSYDLPDRDCDVIVELIDNSYDKKYELRIVDLRVSELTTNCKNEVQPNFTTLNLDLGENKIDRSGLEQWQTLVGIAKYLNRTHKMVEVELIQKKLGIFDSNISIKIWNIGLQALRECGWQIEIFENYPKTKLKVAIADHLFTQESTWQYKDMVQKFVQANDEFRFRQQYLYFQQLHSLKDTERNSERNSERNFESKRSLNLQLSK